MGLNHEEHDIKDDRVGNNMESEGEYIGREPVPAEEYMDMDQTPVRAQGYSRLGVKIAGGKQTKRPYYS